MPWLNPKTDWSAEDGVRDFDLNRMEGNILELYNEMKIRSAVTRYVHNISGSDETGDGSQAKPYKTIQKAINSLPKVLSGYNATINISSGTYNEAVVIDGFAGRLQLTGVSGATVNITSLTVNACVVLISNMTLKASSSGSAIEVTNGGTLLCTSGNLATHNTSTGTSGVTVTNMSRLYVANTLTATGIGGGSAIVCSKGGMAHVYALAGSNKNNGFEATHGGKLSYVNSTFTPSGALSATYTGGRIYNGAQTSVPNY